MVEAGSVFSAPGLESKPGKKGRGIRIKMVIKGDVNIDVFTWVDGCLFE